MYSSVRMRPGVLMYCYAVLGEFLTRNKSGTQVLLINIDILRLKSTKWDLPYEDR